jgi:LysM repeat protein
MALKRVLVLISILLLVAMLGACVRSASTQPARVATPPTEVTAEEGQPVEVTSEAPGAVPGEASQEAPKGQPGAPNEVLQQLELFVTQTAAAAQITGGEAPAGEQPAAGVQETPMAPAEGGQTTEAPAGGEQAPVEQPPVEQQPVEQQPVEQQPVEQQPVEQQPVEQQPAAQQPGIQPTVAQPQAPATGGQAAASQPTRAPVPTATPGIPKSYTLQSGEFPYCIARRFNVNPFELLSLNGLSTSSLVRGGTTLRIPQTGNPFPGQRSLKSHPATYTVKGGENIYEIACMFGEPSPDMIALVNNLPEPFTLTAGQELYIP